MIGSQLVNYTLNMVGGTSGGPIDNTTDTKSFHGDQEIVAEKYILCAREMEPNQGIGSYQVDRAGVNAMLSFC